MRTLNILLAAGAAAALAACGSDPVVNNTTANEIDANLMLEEPANDASAMEATGNATEAPPLDNSTVENEVRETEGGDTGGNNVESNTVGM